MIESIFAYLMNQSTPLSYTQIKNHFGIVNESTITRILKKLVSDGKIHKIKIGKNTWYERINTYQNIIDFFKTPYFERKISSYNPDFLASYIPNTTSFLGDHASKIYKEVEKINKLQTVDYLVNRRGIENMLIDMSYSSSKLEGNMYSYLETEVLVKYNETAVGKSKIDTQMILNHKEVIQHLIDHKNEITLDKRNFFDIHSLLGKELLRDEDLGRIRTTPVKIGGSTYAPLDNAFQLVQEADLFFEKLEAITNPFEQSLFILTFIPYFQLFLDINKRTSRISANIPLLKHGLPILSLLQVSETDYITAILAVYELNDVSLLAELYTNNYLLNMHRYLPPQ